MCACSHREYYSHLTNLNATYLSIPLIFSTEGGEEAQRLFDVQRRVEEDGEHS